MMSSAVPRSSSQAGDILQKYYAKMLEELGPQRWWPARTRLEVILGAILTQNTAWHNAALAIHRLRHAGLLDLARLRKATLAELQDSIRPAGFFQQKARTIRAFLDWLFASHAGSLRACFAMPADRLRRELSSLKGIGPETADAILLYAAKQPFFVADAYTRRILARHELISPSAHYAEAQEYLHRQLPADAALFNEYHALLVEVGKRNCRRGAPSCDDCPLKEFLPQRHAAGAVA